MASDVFNLFALDSFPSCRAQVFSHGMFTHGDINSQPTPFITVEVKQLERLRMLSRYQTFIANTSQKSVSSK